MPKTEPRICGLVRWHAKRSDACARAININLSSDLARRFGRIQGIFAAPITTKQADAVVAHLEDAFTRGALEAARQRPPQTPQETLFEDAVAVTNKTVARVFGESGLGLDPHQATGAIMSVLGGEIVFAVWGTPELLLYRFPAGEGRTKIFNLLEGDEGTPRGRTGFTSVISGRLGPGDRLIAATRSVRDIIGPDRLEKALRQNPSGAIEEMREALTEANDNAAVAVLVADVAEARYVEEEENFPNLTETSVRRLEKTTTMTNEVLSPSLTKTVVAAARVVAAATADTASAAASAAGEAIRQKQEAMRLAAEERARIAAEEAKKPKWLRPGDQIVGEQEVEVGGQKFMVPIVEMVHEEFDLSALAEEERAKTKTNWGAAPNQEEALPEEDPSGTETLPAEEPWPEEEAPAEEPAEEQETELSKIMAFATAPDEDPPPAVDQPPSADSYQTTAVNLQPSTDHEGQAPAQAAAPTPDNPIVLDVLALVKGAFTRTFAAAAFATRAVVTSRGRQEFPRRAKEAVAGLRRAWGESSLLRKAAALAVLAAIVLGVVGLAVSGIASRREAARLAKARLIERVTQGITDIDAALLYPNNEKRAGELLAEMTAVLEKYVPGDEAERQVRDQLALQLEGKAAAVRKEAPLGEPTAVTDVQGVSGISRLALGKGVTWLADAQGKIYALKTGGGSPTAAAQLPGKAVPSALAVSAAGILAVAPDGTSVFVGNDGKEAARKVPLSGETVADAAVYADRLYVLDAAHNRIMRHNPSEGGWGEGQGYLKDGTNLEGSAAMVVDNYIYVLRPDGEVIRLNKGLKEEFRAAVPLPTLTAARVLRAPAGGDALYALEPDTGRIVRWSRADGSLAAQYVAEGLKGASDFQVSADSKTLTVANGNRVLTYRVP